MDYPIDDRYPLILKNNRYPWWLVNVGYIMWCVYIYTYIYIYLLYHHCHWSLYWVYMGIPYHLSSCCSNSWKIVGWMLVESPFFVTPMAVWLYCSKHPDTTWGWLFSGFQHLRKSQSTTGCLFINHPKSAKFPFSWLHQTKPTVSSDSISTFL